MKTLVLCLGGAAIASGAEIAIALGMLRFNCHRRSAWQATSLAFGFEKEIFQ